MTHDPFGPAADTLTAKFARCLTAAAVANPERLALELVTIVRGHGWRPVEALQPPARVPGSTCSGPSAEYLQLKAAIDSRPDCVCGASVLDHQLVNGRRAGCPSTSCENYAPVPDRSNT